MQVACFALVMAMLLPLSILYSRPQAENVEKEVTIDYTQEIHTEIQSFSMYQEIEAPTVIPSTAPFVRTRGVDVGEPTSIPIKGEPTSMLIKEEPVFTYSDEEPTPIPIKEEPVFTYSDEELDLLSRLVQAEGGIESYECKLAIASVVMNRIKSEEFPDTMEEVIYQRKPNVQFSVILKNKGKAPIDSPASDDAIKAAKYVLENGSTLPDDVLVFYASYCDEGWVTSRKTYQQIDSTIFAYIYK